MKLTFDILKDAWKRIKTEKAADMMARVPGLIHPEKVFIKRQSEDDQYISVSFQGFAQAVQSIQKDVPLLKNAIVSWLRQFADDVQLIRGENEILLVRIAKGTSKLSPRKLNKTAPVSTKYDNQINQAAKNLTNIIRRKAVGSQDAKTK